MKKWALNLAISGDQMRYKKSNTPLYVRIKPNGKFSVSMTIEGLLYCIGTYSSIDEAILERNKVLNEWYGKNCWWNTTDRQTDHPLFSTWRNMIARCYVESNKCYEMYGGRGIKADGAWRWSFAKFVYDMPLKPSEKHSLDRINSNGNYYKGNCRWATATEQANNTRRNVIVTYEGKTDTLTRMVKEFSCVSYCNARKRIANGWTVEDAFTVPKNKNNPNRIKLTNNK